MPSNDGQLCIPIQESNTNFIDRMQSDQLLSNVASHLIPSISKNSFIPKLAILECNKHKISQLDLLQNQITLVCFETLYYITDYNGQLGRYHFIDCVSNHLEDVDIVKCEKLMFRFVSS